MVGVVSKHEILPLNMAFSYAFQVQVEQVQQVVEVAKVALLELEAHSSCGNTGVLVLKEIHMWHGGSEGDRHHQNKH